MHINPILNVIHTMNFIDIVCKYPNIIHYNIKFITKAGSLQRSMKFRISRQQHRLKFIATSTKQSLTAMPREASCHCWCDGHHWSPFGFLSKQTSWRSPSTFQRLLELRPCTSSLPSYLSRLSPSNPVLLFALFWIVVWMEWFGMLLQLVHSHCTHLAVRPGRRSPSFHFVSKSPESIASKKAVLWGIHWKGHNDNWEENQTQEIHNLKFESLKRKCKKYSYITYPHARVSGAEEEQAELNQSAKEQVLARNTLHDQHGKSSILWRFVVDH